MANLASLRAMTAGPFSNGAAKPLKPTDTPLGAILAGGEGTRMGGNKHLATLAGTPLIAHVIARLKPQVGALAVCGNHPSLREWEEICLPDADALDGPVAGLRSALGWALKRNAPLITAACDLPFLPPDLTALLGGESVAVPSVSGRPLWVVSYWPSHALAQGCAWLDDLPWPSAPSLASVYRALGARHVAAEDDTAFMGANSPQSLAAAEQYLRGEQP